MAEMGAHWLIVQLLISVRTQTQGIGRMICVPVHIATYVKEIDKGMRLKKRILFLNQSTQNTCKTAVKTTAKGFLKIS